MQRRAFPSLSLASLVPLVFFLGQPQKVADQCAAGAAVGHDDSTLSFVDVRGQIALKSPIAGSMQEIPIQAASFGGCLEVTPGRLSFLNLFPYH